MELFPSVQNYLTINQVQADLKTEVEEGFFECSWWGKKNCCYFWRCRLRLFLSLILPLFIFKIIYSLLHCSHHIVTSFHSCETMRQEMKDFLKCAQKVVSYPLRFVSSNLLTDFKLFIGAEHLAQCKEVKWNCFRELGFRKTLVLYCHSSTDIMWEQNDRLCPKSLRKLLCVESTKQSVGAEIWRYSKYFVINLLSTFISVCVFEGWLMPFSTLHPCSLQNWGVTVSSLPVIPFLNHMRETLSTVGFWAAASDGAVHTVLQKQCWTGAPIFTQNLLWKTPRGQMTLCALSR